MTIKRNRGRPRYADVLTPAEWRTVEAVRHGLTNREVAARHGISLDAVKFHVSNALLKLGLSNKADLKKWDGVALASLRADQEAKMPGSGTLGGISQISRNVSNIEKACDWYSEVLGLNQLFAFGDMAFFDCDGVRLYLQQVDGALPADSILYFKVDDIQVAYKRLTDNGATFASAPHKVHTHANGAEEWMAFFDDLDGRPLAIVALYQPDQ